MAIATLGGGCFWCLEAVFERIKGVSSVVSGYSAGQHPQPTYALICSGKTGHAEVIQIEFDPNIISYENLLDVFFAIHDSWFGKMRESREIFSLYILCS